MNKKLVCVGLFSLLMVACSSNQAPVVAANTAVNNPVPTIPPAPDNSNMTTTDNSATNNAATNSVYFAFNQYDIDTQYDAVITTNANYLAAHTGASVKVEGNTDDIGSVEYNLALGQRRADAVKKALIARGASSAQVEAISDGKLMPKFSNDSDDGRTQNRRTDILFIKQAPTGYYINNNNLPVFK